MAEPRRLDREAHRRLRTSAARCAWARSPARSCRARSRTASTAATTVAERHRHRYEVNNHYLPRHRGGRAGRRRARARATTAGDLCEMVELPGASVVLRLPVPPRVHVESAARPSAVHRLRPRGARSASSAARRRRQPRSRRSLAAERASRRERCVAVDRSRRAMKLCGFEVGLDRPLFLIAGPCVVESRQLQIDVAGELQGDLRGARHPVHLQVVVRQGQPQLAARRFAARAWTRACASSPK